MCSRPGRLEEKTECVNGLETCLEKGGWKVGFHERNERCRERLKMNDEMKKWRHHEVTCCLREGKSCDSGERFDRELNQERDIETEVSINLVV